MQHASIQASWYSDYYEASWLRHDTHASSLIRHNWHLLTGLCPTQRTRVCFQWYWLLSTWVMGHEVLLRVGGPHQESSGETLFCFWWVDSILQHLQGLLSSNAAASTATRLGLPLIQSWPPSTVGIRFFLSFWSTNGHHYACTARVHKWSFNLSNWAARAVPHRAPASAHAPACDALAAPVVIVSCLLPHWSILPSICPAVRLMSMYYATLLI